MSHYCHLVASGAIALLMNPWCDENSSAVVILCRASCGTPSNLKQLSFDYKELALAAVPLRQWSTIALETTFFLLLSDAQYLLTPTRGQGRMLGYVYLQLAELSIVGCLVAPGMAFCWPTEKTHKL